MLLAAMLSAGCASSRVLSSPYDKVAAAAKNRFNVNTWTPNGSRRATLKEKRNYIEIEYWEWEFPNVKIYSVIQVKEQSRGRCKVRVYVKDCDSWFYPFTFSPSLATGVLDAFEERMKWHKFKWGGMPWDEFNKKEAGGS